MKWTRHWGLTEEDLQKAISDAYHKNPGKNVSIAMIKDLRNKTAMGMMDCKIALHEYVRKTYGEDVKTVIR